jgi:hypothetical protein
MSSSKRLALFGVAAAALLAMVAVVLRVLPGAPVPSPLCDATSLLLDQERHASAMRGWLAQSHLSVFAVLLVLTFSWLYLQITHGLPRLWVVVGNSLLILLASFASGAWVRSTASNWAFSQAGTCMDETLQSPYRWNVSYLTSTSDAFRFAGWDWAVFSDAFTLAIGAVLMASLSYLAIRKAANI